MANDMKGYFFKATKRTLTNPELEDANLLAETAKEINEFLNSAESIVR